MEKILYYYLITFHIYDIIFSRGSGVDVKIKVGKKVYDIIFLNTFWLKLKSLKFFLDPIEDIYMLKKKGLSTYWFCQKIDVIMTDKENKILYIYKKFRTDSFIFPKRKVSYIYLAPIGVSDYFKVGDEFKVKEKE